MRLQGIPKLKQENQHLHFAHNKHTFPYILIGGGIFFDKRGTSG